MVSEESRCLPSHAEAATALIGRQERGSVQSLASEATYLAGKLLRCTLSSDKESAQEPRGTLCVRQNPESQCFGHLAWPKWPIQRRCNTRRAHLQALSFKGTVKNPVASKRDTRGGESAKTKKDAPRGTTLCQSTKKPLNTAKDSNDGTT